MTDYEIKEIDNAFIRALLENDNGYSPLGLFLLKDRDRYVAVDNSDGNAWTEEFASKGEAIHWLKEEPYEVVITYTISRKVIVDSEHGLDPLLAVEDAFYQGAFDNEISYDENWKFVSVDFEDCTDY